jgi:uncharacterized protein YjbI with pentapeptide repeats
MFHGCDLSRANLSGSVMAGTTFYQCGLTEAHLEDTDLRGATFNESTMDRADLSGAQLDDAVMLRCSIRAATLRAVRGENVSISRPTQADGLVLADAHLPRLRLEKVRARDVHGRDLRATGATVHQSHFSESDFSGADLSRSHWTAVALNQVVLSGASVGDAFWSDVSAPELDAQRLRAEGWTATECRFTTANFAGFAGRYSTFRNCDMHQINLRGAYFYRATIVGDPPSSACLVEANLDGANLTQAYLAADFTGASLRAGWATYARLNQSTFTKADLAGTSLFHASAVKTVFTDTRVSGQRGLLFADRCPGLIDALTSGSDDKAEHIARLVQALGELLDRDTGKST